MSDPERKPRRWPKVALGLVLFLLVVFVAFVGARTPWVRPCPGVSLDTARPIVSANDMAPDSAFHLLRRAFQASPAPLPGFGYGGEIRRGVVAKLRAHPWPGVNLANPPPLSPQPTAAWSLIDLGVPQSAWSPEQCESLRQVAALFVDGTELLDQALAMPAAARLIPADASLTALVQGQSMALVQWLHISAEFQAATGDTDGCFAALDRLWDLASLLGSSADRMDNQLAGAAFRYAAESAWYQAVHRDIPAPTLVRAAKKSLAASDDALLPADYIRLRAQALCSQPELGGWRYATQALGLRPPFRAGPKMPLPSPSLRALLHTVAFLAPLEGSGRSGIQRDLEFFSQQAVAIAEAPCSSAKADAAYRGLAEPPTSRWQMARVLSRVRDPVGYFAAIPVADEFAAVHMNTMSQLLSSRSLALFLAVKAYEQEHGTLPEPLELLVPDYLPRVPRDPGSGQPLCLERDHGRAQEPPGWTIWNTVELPGAVGGTPCRYVCWASRVNWPVPLAPY